MSAKVGVNQVLVLDGLQRNGGWQPGRWALMNKSHTVRILESLVRRRFAVKVIDRTEDGMWYKITNEGRAALARENWANR